jgi:amidohydrolase
MLPRKNGVVCDVGPGDAAAPVVAIRADLDALPLQDLKDVRYRSTVPNVCHACGHDVHATIVLGIALALAEMRSALPGVVRFIFQPAEEILPCGSLEMIDFGALEGVSQIYGLHCDPHLEVGGVGLRAGALTAAADNLVVKLSGKGGHTARPQLTSDLITALARVVTDVPAIVARKVDARSALLIVFGAMQAGTTYNAIPTSGHVAGTVRMLDIETWKAAPEIVSEVVRQVVAPFGAEVSLEYLRGRPPVINDAQCIEVIRAAAILEMGVSAVRDTPQSMGGEDFSWYLQHTPGAMFRLGVARPGERLDLHQGSFDVAEGAIEIGIRLLARTAIRALHALSMPTALEPPADAAVPPVNLGRG